MPHRVFKYIKTSVISVDCRLGIVDHRQMRGRPFPYLLASVITKVSLHLTNSIQIARPESTFLPQCPVHCVAQRYFPEVPSSIQLGSLDRPSCFTIFVTM